MDYGDRPVHAIEIIPDPTAICFESNLPSLDQSIWATEDDYRAWNGDPSTDSISNQANDGRQPNNKKPRTSLQGESAPSKSKLLGRMFFKTKLCCRFRAGTCPYISNCNFAHGMEELRKPPPNWQEIVAAHEDGAPVEVREERQIPVMTTSPVSLVDGQRLYKGRHCRRFFTDEGCPYGEACGYTHEDPLMRESVTISLSPTFVGGGHMGGGNGLIQKPSNWKTRICNKWEMTGYCPFGNKCHFAHGSAELHRVGGGLVETDGRDASAATVDLKPAGAFAKLANDAVAALAVSVPHGDAYHGGRSAMASQRPAQRPTHNWKGPDKISRIYGDWIDDNE